MHHGRALHPPPLNEPPSPSHAPLPLAPCPSLLADKLVATSPVHKPSNTTRKSSRDTRSHLFKQIPPRSAREAKPVWTTDSCSDIWKSVSAIIWFTV